MLNTVYGIGCSVYLSTSNGDTMEIPLASVGTASAQRSGILLLVVLGTGPDLCALTRLDVRPRNMLLTEPVY